MYSRFDCVLKLNRKAILELFLDNLYRKNILVAMEKPVLQEKIDLLFQYFGQKAVLTP